MKFTGKTVAWLASAENRLDPAAEAEKGFDQLSFSNNGMMAGVGWVKVGTAEITVDFDSPTDFVERQIEVLNQQIERVNVEAGKRINYFQTCINNLLSLPNEVRSTIVPDPDDDIPF